MAPLEARSWSMLCSIKSRARSSSSSKSARSGVISICGFIKSAGSCLNVASCKKRRVNILKITVVQGGDAEKPDCRNQAFELSKEVQKSILEAGSTLESSDKQGQAGKKFGIRLKAQAAKLNDFANEHQSGLYYKSSWTAGCHMAKILDMAFPRVSIFPVELVCWRSIFI